MKKLTLILGLLLSNLANAASTTYYSGLVPLTGSYNIDLNNTCAPDSSYANSLPPVTGVNEALVGILTITPDTTQTSKVSSLDAYNKWLAYMTPLTGVPSLAPPALSQLKDPTNALVNINETPIQWGALNKPLLNRMYQVHILPQQLLIITLKRLTLLLQNILTQTRL